MNRTEVIALASFASVLGIAITLWVYVPAFRGPIAARRALGTHRLALGSIVSVLVLNFAISLPFAPLLRLDQGMSSATFVIAALSTQVPMLLFVYVRLIRSGAVTWEELGLRPLPRRTLVTWGLGGGVVGLILLDVVGTLLAQYGLRPNQLEQFNFVLTEGPLAFLLLLVSAGVIAPVIEELFFRGFLFGMYRRRQNAFVAYTVSSVLFTVLHLEPGRMTLAQMAGLAVGILMLALILSFLFDRTESLYPSMLAHGLNNATGLLLFYTVGIQ
ncbi:MAG: CPBP family intramembrane metalloprotease [Chloroflexota bacterium]